MKLRLTGHDYKYAVEQIMLMFFPNERPVYSEPGGDGLSADVTLTLGCVYATAVTVIRPENGVYHGSARVKRDKLTEKLETDRLLQRTVKQSFYRAARAATGISPPWGSLTGIRPASLAASMLESGRSSTSVSTALTSEYYVSPERAALCIDAARVKLEVKHQLTQRDAALYVGIPFCPTRCAYCSFVSSSVEKSFKLIEPFVEALLSEIDAVSVVARELGLRVVTVYIGGGTPTALPASQLETVMHRLREAFDLSEAREYTVEAGRPDTITREKLDIMQKLGATRVSVNPQSMSADTLRAIGRNHTPEDTLGAVRLVREVCGIEALNMDLIAGLPGDSPESFCRSLDAVLELRPENVTVHTLSLKKGSRITLEGTPIPDGGAVAKMLDYSSMRLGGRGYAPYYLYRQKFTSGGFENVGWSLPGFENLYNVCMMEELCTVLALGGGGVTKLVSPGGRIERCFNVKYPLEYIGRGDKTSGKLERITGFYSLEEDDGL